eukprot:scaffold27503_cov23-Tisochrysis_lutea.AAC.1
MAAKDGCSPRATHSSTCFVTSSCAATRLRSLRALHQRPRRGERGAHPAVMSGAESERAILCTHVVLRWRQKHRRRLLDEC